jgi:hypothetical protein
MSPSLPVRHRIKGHRRVRAGDLVPHELNPRLHPAAQRAALEALYREVGFARSLLAYELPDGQLKLIDGHLRQSLDPDMEVEVEVLDVDDAEARALLLSIDPLARLAENDAETLAGLRRLTATDSEALAALWDSVAAAGAATGRAAREARDADPAPPVPEQYLLLVECTDEAEQVRLLERFQAEGIRCRALLS